MTNGIIYNRLEDRADPAVFDQLARIHREEIDGGFLTSLGHRFLRRLYGALSGCPHACTIVAQSQDEVVGFICCTTDTRKVYRHFLLRYGLFVLPAVLPALLSPARIRRILETLLHPVREADYESPPAQILNFCVASSRQRQGVGKTLFAKLVDEFRKKDVESLKIVTGAGQQKAQRFYESLGAEKVARTSVHGGETSYVYVYRITPGEVRSAVA